MVNTVGQLLLNTIKEFPKENLFLYKEAKQYVPISTEDYGRKVRHFALGLKDLGMRSGDKMVILAENGPLWVMSDLANMSLGGITVPIYTSLVPEQIRYIIDDSDAKVVICSDLSLWRKIEAIRGELSKVEHFILLKPTAPEGVFTLDEVLAKGRMMTEKQPGVFEDEALKISPEDVATIIYTSGTTGIPKGVILTHSNFISNVKTSAELLRFSENDIVLSFLPLSHVLERMVTLAYLYRGCSVAYAENVGTVAVNLQEIRPHIMVSVPRVFEKIYSKVMDNVLSSSGTKKKIFFWALKVGKACGERKLQKIKIPAFLGLKHKIAHKLVFSKVINQTGGRIRFFVSGGAALSRDIAEFFYAMGLVIMEGYGLTETSPVIAVNTFEHLKFGTVGRPIPEVEVKIAEDGEIMTKGPNVMKGYYKKEQDTADVFKDGWFLTGDIGHLDDDGMLVITDRKKDLIVTAGGKNVAPQPIENILKMNPYIANAVVLGDKRKYIAALIVPEIEKLRQYAREHNLEFENDTQLVEKDEIRKFIKNEIALATSGLSPYEKVKKIFILDRDFEIEKGEMTPSLKIKRNIVEEKYQKEIEALYRNNNTLFPEEVE